LVALAALRPGKQALFAGKNMIEPHLQETQETQSPELPTDSWVFPFYADGLQDSSLPPFSFLSFFFFFFFGGGTEI
jgi:hypothetical protein